MKTMKNFLSMAALALMGAMMTGCSSEDNVIDNPQQPQNKDNVVTLTTTVGFDSGTTRALTSGGVKTFAAGDQIAVIYKNTIDQTVMALSEALPAGDYGKSATFTVTLSNPKASEAVRYIYPAAMAAASVATDAAVNADANVNYAALDTQDGTLATLASSLDLAIFDGSLTDGAALPASASMTNQFAILACTLKDNAATPTEITSSITGMTVSDGTNTYTITRTAVAGPIYVAIRPTDNAPITITATDGTKNYTKSLIDKTYAASNGYSVSWRMLPEGALPGKFTVNGSGKQVYFSRGNLRATYNGSSWSWAFAKNQWNYIGGRSNSVYETQTGNNFINGNGTLSANGTVDLFGWVGASSSWTGVAQYGISNSTNNNSTDGYGKDADENLKSDWGTLAITNGGNTANSGWFTLTKDEWDYLFNHRTASTVNGTVNGRYAKAKVSGVSGVILFPDSYTHPDGVAAPTGVNTENVKFIDAISYDATVWGKMESAGAVFLPAAGYRSGSTIYGVGSNVSYWSSSPYTSIESAYRMFSSSTSLDPQSRNLRYYGHSVRLVRVAD